MKPETGAHRRQLLPGWPGHLATLLCGTLPTLSLAPFTLWPLGIIACALLYALLHEQKPLVCTLRCWLFGIGLFGSGASWVYVSIQQHGNAPPALAACLVLLFTLAMAAIFAIMAPIIHLATRAAGSIGNGVAFAACWTLGEWLRCWLLTGFPWLLLGAAHVDTYLSGWAPVSGVLGISFIIALSGAALVQLIRLRGPRRWILTAVSTAMWSSGAALQHISWVEAAGPPLKVALIQPDIPQHLKWRPEAFDSIIRTYQSLTADNWNADLIIWPEAAIPRLYQYIPRQIAELDQQAKDAEATLITGIPYRVTAADPTAAEQGNLYYNSVVALGTGSGLYFKQRLVPFGEYVPLEHWLRGIIDFFDLPTSHMSWGPTDQNLLRIGRLRLAPFVCYEIVYPDLVASDSRNAHFIVNISNDSWFGHSIGPLQHFQIARMRALENGRYLLRGTNNGVTAIVDHRGRIIQRAEQFSRSVLRGEALPLQGNTPFSRLGSIPVLIICLALLALNICRSIRHTAGHRTDNTTSPE